MAKNNKDLKIYLVSEVDTGVIKGVYCQKANTESCFEALKTDSQVNYGIQEHIIQDSFVTL